MTPMLSGEEIIAELFYMKALMNLLSDKLCLLGMNVVCEGKQRYVLARN